MSRMIVMFAAASLVAVAAHAQDTTVKTQTKTSGDAPQMVTYTGCVQQGTQARSYMLSKIVPVSRTTATEPGAAGTSGTITTTTTYALVPDEKVIVDEHVGQKVEVTGMLIPAGDSKTTTTTKVEREDAPDSKTTTTVKRDNAFPEFRVTSIKKVADRCD